MISSIIKILISIAGVLAAGFFLAIGLANRSRSYVKTGGMVLLITCGIVVAITALEFLLWD